MIESAAVGTIERPLQVPAARALALRWAPLLLVLLLGGLLCAQAITSESSAFARGDTARYLMNGVFFLDLAKDRPGVTPATLIEWAQLYYARYPALSVGHHPVLLPIAQAVAYGVFGVSVFSARLVLLAFFLALLAWQYGLVRQQYGTLAAFLATLVLAVNPLLVHYGRSVLSEMPTLALAVGACYYLLRYEKSDRTRDLVLAAALILLAMYAKQLAAFMVPLAAAHLVWARGWRHLFSRRVLLIAGAGAVLVAPLVAMTIVLSPHNVTMATGVAKGGWPQKLGAAGLFAKTVQGQLIVPAALLSAVAVVVAIVRRDRRAVFFVLWIAMVFGQIYWFTGGLEPERYAMYWIPAFAALAASTVAHLTRHELRWAFAAVLIATAAYQGVKSARKPVPTTSSYDEAASWVAATAKGDAVLFSGPFDTGLFVFGIRKYDPARQMVVLRADKLLTTRSMIRTDDRIKSTDEIYSVLHRFGVSMVVLEDAPTGSPALELLRGEVRSPRFAERRRWTILSSDARVNGTPLLAYEYLHATPADRAAPLDMDLPLVGRSFNLRFGDLLDRRTR